MSLERAAVNCRRCRELAENHKINGKVNDGMAIKDDQVYGARNDAMKALEEEIRKIDFYLVNKVELGEYAKRRQMIDRTKVIEALEDCVGCDYSLPKIAVKYLGKKFLGLEEKDKEEKEND